MNFPRITHPRNKKSDKNYTYLVKFIYRPSSKHCWHDVNSEALLSKVIAPQCANLRGRRMNAKLNRTQTNKFLIFLQSSISPALASSTGVGLWRLSSSVCHMEVISLTYQNQKQSNCRYSWTHTKYSRFSKSWSSTQYQIFDQHLSIFMAKIGSVVVFQEMLQGEKGYVRAKNYQ